jgi:hypothetical protein
MPATIDLASNETAIKRCCAVLRQLRPHLEEGAMMRQIVRQQTTGYLLAYCESEKVIRSVAGYRYGENLAYGKYMYVDDLVTNRDDRSKGFGKLLFDWLVVSGQRTGLPGPHIGFRGSTVWCPSLLPYQSDGHCLSSLLFAPLNHRRSQTALPFGDLEGVRSIGAAEPDGTRRRRKRPINSSPNRNKAAPGDLRFSD